MLPLEIVMKLTLELAADVAVLLLACALQLDHFAAQTMLQEMALLVPTAPALLLATKMSVLV